jgi:phosphinothricin acetyltransferase
MAATMLGKPCPLRDMPCMMIAAASEADIPAITAIYAHHVLNGTATFEIEPPDEAEFAHRLRKVNEARAPWLVARGDGGEVLGYAYAAPFRDRPAYRFTCENSIYVRHDRLGQGVGRELLAELLEAACEAGFRQMLAVIGGGEPASVALHEAAGFEHAGRMRSVGRKFGRWLDTVYMQRALGDGDRTAAEEEPG